MIDIHTHVLFGVDDGPKTLEESLELLKQASHMGFKEIVLSSHYKVDRYENEKYAKNFNILKEAIKNHEIPIDIHSGNEVYLDIGIENHLPKTQNLKDSNYLLVEFHPMINMIAAQALINRVKKSGYNPVLAHVERYMNLTVDNLKKLKESEVIFQTNIKSVENIDRKLHWLLKNGMIDILASDTHRIGKRDYNFKDQLTEIQKIVGEKNLKKMISENPRTILNNGVIE